MRIGYCLSGGGVRGLAHLGVLQALEENKIYPSVIAGTSAGAIMGAFYSAGFSPVEILNIAVKRNFLSPSGLLLGKAGLFNMRYFEKIYLEYFPHNDFSELKIPLITTATDLGKGAVHYFSEGSLSLALMASSAIPLVFEPVTEGGAVYVDGGVLDNLPVEALNGKCDKIIGIHVNAIPLGKVSIHMRDIMDRVFHLALGTSVYTKAPLCDLFIDPPDMIRFPMLDIKKAGAIFEYAYRYTRSLLAKPETLQLLKERQ